MGFKHLLFLNLITFIMFIHLGCGSKSNSEKKPIKLNRKITDESVSLNFEHLQKAKNIIVFDGKIAQTSKLPKVKEMSYDDLLSTINVDVQKTIQGKIDSKQMLLQVPVIRMRKPLAAASFKSGDNVRFYVIPFDNADDATQSIQQVDDVQDYESTPYFAIGYEKQGAKPVIDGKKVSTDRDTHIKNARKNILSELKTEGNGSWETWFEKLEPFYEEIDRRASILPKEKFGKHGLIIEPSLPVEIKGHPPKENVHLQQVLTFNKALAQKGIDLIYVSVPRPWLIWPEKVTNVQPESQFVTPNYRHFLLELLNNDVEVVDTLPTLLKEKTSSEGPFFVPNSDDLHPTIPAMRIIAKMVSQRLKRYGFTQNSYEFLSKKLVANITNTHQTISPDGSTYKDAIDSPILVIGNSLTRINVPGPSTGFTGHLSRALGIRVSHFQRDAFKLADLAKAPNKTLKNKKVLIWINWTICANKMYPDFCSKHEIKNWDKTRVMTK